MLGIINNEFRRYSFKVWAANENEPGRILIAFFFSAHCYIATPALIRLGKFATLV